VYVKITAQGALQQWRRRHDPATVKQWNIDLASLGVSLKSVKTARDRGWVTAAPVRREPSSSMRSDSMPRRQQLVGGPDRPGQQRPGCPVGLRGDFKDAAGTNHGTPKGDAKIVTDPSGAKVLALDGSGTTGGSQLAVAQVSPATRSPCRRGCGNESATAPAAQIVLARSSAIPRNVSPYFAYGLHF